MEAWLSPAVLPALVPRSFLIYLQNSKSQHRLWGPGKGRETCPVLQPSWARHFLKGILWSWTLSKLRMDKGKMCKYKLGNQGCVMSWEWQIEWNVSKALPLLQADFVCLIGSFHLSPHPLLWVCITWVWVTSVSHCACGAGTPCEPWFSALLC
jgi:hypothetical protein